MKQLTIIISFLLIGITGIANPPPTSVKLKGTLVTGGGGPKSTLTQPVEAYLFDGEIAVHFLDCLNKLTVTIVDENNQTVYSQTVNSCTTSNITINTQNWNSGNYFITISDSYGGSMGGEFFIN